MSNDTTVQPPTELVQPAKLWPERKIAIVGYTITARETPWDDDSWEIWGINDLHRFVPWQRCKKWFDLHSVTELTSDTTDEHRAWLASEQGPPVFVWPYVYKALHNEYPRLVPLDPDALTSQFGRYFTNTISWLIACAIAERATEIGIYGVDMATGSEYGPQRPSVEYFCGLAAGLGIELTIPAASDILKCAVLYGAEWDNQMRVRMQSRQKELAERINASEQAIAQFDQQREAARQQAWQARGAHSQNEYWLNVWFNNEVSSEVRDEQPNTLKEPINLPGGAGSEPAASDGAQADDARTERITMTEQAHVDRVEVPPAPKE